MTNSALLQVENLGKHYPLRGGMFSRTIGTIKAVDGVNFSISEGSSFGLVGESGSGKSTIARCLLRLEEPSFGEVRFNGVNILQLPPEEMRHRRAEMQIVFQDPYASLNPRLTVRDIVAEPLVIHTRLRGEALTARVVELLELVNLSRQQSFSKHSPSHVVHPAAMLTRLVSCPASSPTVVRQGIPTTDDGW